MKRPPKTPRLMGFRFPREIIAYLRPRRHQLSAISYRYARADAFDLWDGYIAEMTA